MPTLNSKDRRTELKTITIMKKSLLLLVTLGMLLSCTRTGDETYHYVKNSTQDKLTADYTLLTGVHQSAVIPANSVLPLTFPNGFLCKLPIDTYSSFYILNAQGDTIMDAMPVDRYDLGNWTIEEDIQEPNRYTKIFIHNYILVIN